MKDYCGLLHPPSSSDDYAVQINRYFPNEPRSLAVVEGVGLVLALEIAKGRGSYLCLLRVKSTFVDVFSLVGRGADFDAWCYSVFEVTCRDSKTFEDHS